MGPQTAKPVSEPPSSASTVGRPGHGPIFFRERMVGWFALGEVDPVAGAARGRAAGSRLALEASIGIDDIEVFVTRPQHRGSLRGAVRFPPLAEALPGDHGVFQLFVPDRATAERRMVYELACRDEGRGESYYFAGEKHVVRRAPWWLWRDTTRLHARLHRGSDRQGEVVAAGVLVLSPWQLARMVGTFRSPKPSSLVRFGAFFTRQLWETYVLRRPPAPIRDDGHGGSPGRVA